MSVIQLTVRYTVSLVQLTVQSCIQTVSCGILFALEFVIFNLLWEYVCHSVDWQIIVSLVQLTVQCCTQTVCCGFQFALQFVTFNLLAQYFCHSVECHLHSQFCSADSTVLYTDFVLWLSVCITLRNILNYCYSVSVINLTVSCTVSMLQVT